MFFPICGPLQIGYMRCLTCGIVYPETSQYFKKDKRRQNGVRARCKSCHNEAGRKYVAEHPEKRREQSRISGAKYRALHPERVRCAIKKWASKNKPYDRERKQKRRAQKRGEVNVFTEQDWQRALRYFDSCCAACGRPPGPWHHLAQDHWIPIVKGGLYTKDNIVPLCHGLDGCNNSKNDSYPNEWLEWKFGKRRARQIAARVEAYFEWVRTRK